MKKLSEGLYKLTIPFEELYTSVFIAVSAQGTVIIDAAACPKDADRYIIPALQELGIEVPDYLLLSHSHSDHVGAAERLCELFPEMKVRAMEEFPLPRWGPMRDGDVFAGRIRAVHLPGHTPFSFGFLDLPSGLLLTCDCLQLRGIGKYVHGIGCMEEYLCSVEKIREMEISGIIAAHEYLPLGCTAIGKEQIRLYLDECIRAAEDYIPE